jgi:hypothetical protein
MANLHTEITFNEYGIRSAIAKHWNVPIENVSIYTKTGNDGKTEIECKITAREDGILVEGDISRQMVHDAYQKGLIQLKVDPNMGAGTVCQIGSFWFYFGGLTAEENSPEEYRRNVPEEDIIDEIFTTLVSFKENFESDERDEYDYYNAYLHEQLNV